MVNEAVNIGFDLPWGEKARTAFHVPPADPLPATYNGLLLRVMPAPSSAPSLVRAIVDSKQLDQPAGARPVFLFKGLHE
jgi:hypothetical protein